METLIIYYKRIKRGAIAPKAPLTCLLSPSGGEETEVDLETRAKRLW